MEHFDLAVIGGGSAGLTAAIIAARVGAKVLLIDRERLGGDCTHYGCIPSKAMIRCARAAHEARRATGYGVEVGEVKVDFARVAAYVRDAIATIERGETPEVMREQGIEVALGGARFLSPTRLRVGAEEFEADRTIIAVGSRATAPELPGLEECGYIDHVGLFSISELPERIAVLGGGPIGVEMGQALARLGAEVTILERSERILRRDDVEVAGLLTEILRDEMGLLCNATVTEVQRAAGGKRLVYEQDGEKRSLDCDEILVAVGRSPNLEALGLDIAGVATNSRGIVVDAAMRTTAKNIWACGDCTGSMQFTHFAEAQARAAARNALFRGEKKLDEQWIPWTTFSDPELAHVGMTEVEAETAGLDAHVHRFSYAHLDRAICEGEARGLAKIVCTRRERILGASIVGPHAGEAISEVVIAMKAGLTLDDLGSVIHVYPTMNRIIRRLADEQFLEHGVGRWTARLFGRFKGRGDS